MQNSSSLRPMGIGTILDRTFKIYRQNFKDMLFFSLLIGSTVTLLVSLFNAGTSMSAGDMLLSPLSGLIDNGFSINAVDDLLAMQGALAGGLLSSIANFIIAVFITPLVSGGISLITLSASLEDGEKNFFKRIKPIWMKLVLTQLAAGVAFILAAIVFLILMGVINIPVMLLSYGSFSGPSAIMIVSIVLFALIYLLFIVAVYAFYCLIFPVAVHENKFGFSAVGRTFSLFRRRFWKSTWLSVLSILMVGALELIALIILAFVPLIVSTAMSTIFMALLTPVTAIAFTLLYLDIRITKEGYDLELRAASLGGNVDDIPNA